MVRSVLKWALIGALVLGLTLGAVHLYLLVSNRGVQLHIGNFNIIRLGSSTAFFPAQFEQSYKPFSPDSPSIREPKYERNTTYASDIQGSILAKNIGSGVEGKFSWNDQTHYMCLSPDAYQVRGLSQPVDPAKALQNYTFLNIGNNVGGTSAADVGYYMFERDVDEGTPVKFILKSETVNSDGGLDILTAIVFTKHTKCVSPIEVMSDFPAL